MNTIKTNIDVSLRAARTARTAVQAIIDELVRLDQATITQSHTAFISMLKANANNDFLTDAEFREFVRTSIKGGL